MQRIVTELTAISDIVSLGLELGIRMSALEEIKADNPQVKQQRMQVVYYWLKRRDIVRTRQDECPTWTGLANAVGSLDHALSERIRCQYC